MTIKIYQVDAFASQLFKGNPAAVCPLSEWLPDEKMMLIAAENNLSETAFFVQKSGQVELRWFTPKIEVNLCGHATLATAFVFFEELGYKEDIIRFQTKSGELTVEKRNHIYMLNFPAKYAEPSSDYPQLMLDALGCSPTEILRYSNDFIVVVKTQDEVERLQPDHSMLRMSGIRAVGVTAVGDEVDFVSRFFAPGSGVDEDPVTGSVHTILIPYWAKKLDKQSFYARQLSQRGGTLKCRLIGDRVEIGGAAKLFLKGEIYL